MIFEKERTMDKEGDIQIENCVEGIKNAAFLYHYTNLCSAIKILMNNTLLFGELCKMNDLQESTRLVFGNDDCRNAIKKYRQISLTSDHPRTGCKKPRKGFDILPMWAHYANKGNGVCIMLDADSIVNRCKEQKGYCGDVLYSREYDNVMCFDSKYPDKELTTKKMINKVFFSKSDEWKYEQEYRIIKRFDSGSPKEHLNINGAVRGVIIAQISYGNPYLEGQNPANSEAFRILRIILHDIPIFLYGADGGVRSLNYGICKEFGTTGYVWRLDKMGEDYYSSNARCLLVNDTD